MGSEIAIALEDTKIPDDNSGVLFTETRDTCGPKVAQIIITDDERLQDVNSESEPNASKSTQALESRSNERIDGLSYEDPESLAESSRRHISTGRKSILLLIFCLAQFLDTFNISELYTALPTISAQLNMNGGESIWLISAYQLSLASCLLVVCFDSCFTS